MFRWRMVKKEGRKPVRKVLVVGPQSMNTVIIGNKGEMARFKKWTDIEVFEI